VAPAKVKLGYVKFLPAFGPLNLALSQATPAEGRGHVDHMGVQVESADIVMRELARVKAAGLPVREEIGVDCCHANQDKFWVEDPDGVDWESMSSTTISRRPRCRWRRGSPCSKSAAAVARRPELAFAEQPLDDHAVAPDAVEPRVTLVDADDAEAAALVERDAGGVLGEDS
jgi:hypothetical protein